MKCIFTLAIVALVAPITAIGGEMTTRLDIEGTHCALCAPAVTKALKEVDGVKNVTVSAAEKQAVVVADESVPTEALTAAVAKAGFSATVAKRN
jgi:mercuric ion binding protein